MLVKEVMTKKVVTIEHDKTVLDACNLYRDKKIGCLIVIENGNCVGIVTERDIIERTICARRDPEKTRVREIMSTNLKTIHALDSLEKALAVMRDNNIKKLPVIVKEGVVGIITVTDISRARPDLSKRFIESWVKPVWRD
ncbi:MAG: hypothetical protein DRM98_03390 [Thermoplasmata archaeon]|nr:MAG: hypothetical protein DRM98_03390 [Thermoplasmata archaeon]